MLCQSGGELGYIAKLLENSQESRWGRGRWFRKATALFRPNAWSNGENFSLSHFEEANMAKKRYEVKAE
jgi:hypothetical protein